MKNHPTLERIPGMKILWVIKPMAYVVMNFTCQFDQDIVHRYLIKYKSIDVSKKIFFQMRLTFKLVD